MYGACLSVVRVPLSFMGKQKPSYPAPYSAGCSAAQTNIRSRDFSNFSSHLAFRKKSTFDQQNPKKKTRTTTGQQLTRRDIEYYVVFEDEACTYNIRLFCARLPLARPITTIVDRVGGVSPTHCLYNRHKHRDKTKTWDTTNSLWKDNIS